VLDGASTESTNFDGVRGTPATRPVTAPYR